MYQKLGSESLLTQPTYQKLGIVKQNQIHQEVGSVSLLTLWFLSQPGTVVWLLTYHQRKKNKQILILMNLEEAKGNSYATNPSKTKKQQFLAFSI